MTLHPLWQVEFVSAGSGNKADGSGRQVWVALGSNRDPERELRQAMDLLMQTFGSVRTSNVYRNAAEGVEGPDFLNCAVTFHTHLPVLELIRTLKTIEDACGRERDASRRGPKGLDLDLLLYGDEVSAMPPLPHPDILDKAYVLAPLADIAADLRHPVTGQTIGELWARMAALTSPRFDRHPLA